MNALHLPHDLMSRAETAAAEQGRTVEAMTVQLWSDYLKELEDARETKAILTRIDSGEEETISLEEMIARYGIADE